MTRHKDTPLMKRLKQQGLPAPKQPTVTTSLLDVMVDGREFESLLKYQAQVPVLPEIRRSLKEITDIRKVPIVAYIANVVRQTTVSNGIDDSDDLPFNEMIRSLPAEAKEIDIVLVTPGGQANQVAKFVNTLRPRFDKVNFILLNQAMSAGTIFALSGDEVIMTNESQIGPIDPQVRNKDGAFVPAQSLLTLIDEIKIRGEALAREKKPIPWTDIQILKNLDLKEVGNAINASDYSIKMVEEYLNAYKFKTWAKHKDGTVVTPEKKKERATEIASLLCKHSEWKHHGHAIRREAAWDVCRLKITHAEKIGIERPMRRMWALFYWLFENTVPGMVKIFVSENYCVIRNDTPKK